jgi:hypothetical protein
LKLRRTLFEILFGALGIGIAINYGMMSPSHPFIVNVITGAVIAIGSRFLALVIGG